MTPISRHGPGICPPVAEGCVIGIEVKASATVRGADLRGLRQLQDAVGDKFVQGLVLHDHDRIIPFGEKLHAGPVSLLW